MAACKFFSTAFRIQSLRLVVELSSSTLLFCSDNMLILPAASLTNSFGLPEALFTLDVACCSSSEKSDSKLLRLN